MLILFIGKEEEDYRNDNIKFDNSLENKINSEPFYKKGNKSINNLNIFDDSNVNIKRKCSHIITSIVGMIHFFVYILLL